MRSTFQQESDWRRSAMITNSCVRAGYTIGHSQTALKVYVRTRGKGKKLQVLPLRSEPAPAWEMMLGQDARQIQAQWLHTIGNLTLTGYNPELSNQPYPEKRKILAQSHFELNRHFNHVDTWTGEEILKRSQTLFSLASKIWPRPSLRSEEEAPAQPRLQPANFHADCVRAAEMKLGAKFSKLSQTRYEVGGSGIRLVCAVSAEHNENKDTPYFWFALHRKQLEFLKKAAHSWLCYGCGMPANTFLLPTETVQEHLDQMSTSSAEGRRYWHVVIQRKQNRFVLRLLGAVDGPDLTPYLV